MEKLFLYGFVDIRKKTLKTRIYINNFLIILLLFLLVPGCGDQPKDSSECECKKGKKGITSEYKGGSELYDIYGKKVDMEGVPARVVSLVPAITEMIQAVRPKYRLKGVTHFDANQPIARSAEIVGGFFSPNLERVRYLKPGLIFASSLHKKIHHGFRESGCPVVVLDAQKIDHIYRNIEIIGRIFHGCKNAMNKIEEIKSQVDLINKKLSRVPAEKRLRVMRLMGRDSVMTPGEDSFQNEAIRLAGGIPIKTGRKGGIVDVKLEEWGKFNPQVLYGCGQDKRLWKRLSGMSGWKSVDAVKNKRYISFPCCLTCRASVNFGYFIQWLSASLYGDHFFTSPPVQKDMLTKEKMVKLELPYVKSASIKYGTIDDFVHKTLVIEFSEALDVVSSIDGFRRVVYAGSHYLSPPRWNEGHRLGIKQMRAKICDAVNIDPESTAFLATGADMDNLAVAVKSYKRFRAYALVTAGVESNAQRQSKDEGLYYPAGTINIIVLTNQHLSQRAVTRAIITATEAKTAAIEDLDIRSTYTPLKNPATGTGTDNVLIVSGKGKPLDAAGGHTKMGELIARAVYDGVTRAIEKQNRLRVKRSIFKRLKERKISLFETAGQAVKGMPKAPGTFDLVGEMENVLLDERVKGFMEMALSVADAHTRGLVTDCAYFDKWGLDVARDISGKEIKCLLKIDESSNLPASIRTALSAIVTGSLYRLKDENKREK